MKFYVRKKDYQLIIKAKISFNEKIDDSELDLFSRKYVRGFMKPKKIRRRQLEYIGPVGISLYERMKNTVSKYDFFFIIEQIVDCTQKLNKIGLPLSKLKLDIRSVFINEMTKEIQFIYMPLVTVIDQNDPIDFIESIVYSAIPRSETDSDEIAKFAYFIKSLNAYQPERIEGYISHNVDRNIVSTIKKRNCGQSGFMTDKPKDYYAHYDNKFNDNVDDEKTDLLDECSEDKDDELTELLEQDDEATGLLDDDTGLLDETANEIYPTLKRLLTGEIIRINKPVFRLGKEKSYVDYFVNNNVAVSRSHADVICRNGKYFVVDLNSKNHTLLNNRIIPPNCETEICNGDLLKLADEEFIFYTDL